VLTKVHLWTIIFQGWEKVPLLAMETVGSECFNMSVKAGKLMEVQLTSIAKTLGARTVTPALMEVLPRFTIHSHVLPDKEAVRGCIKFAGLLVYLI